MEAETHSLLKKMRSDAEKARAEAAEIVQKDTIRSQQLLIYAHMVLNIVGICVLLQARPVLAMAAFKRAGVPSNKLAGSVAEFGGKMTAAIGVLEFVLNPTVGKLSDALGRRVILLTFPIINCLLKLMVFFHPDNLSVVFFERTVNGAVTTLAGSTTCSAALSDITPEKELGQAYAELGSAAGFGAILGSWVAGRLSASGSTPRANFLFASGLAAMQWIFDYFALSETLLKESRKPLPKEASAMMANPLRFLKLFSHNTKLSLLVVVAGLQCMPEGKNISDLHQNYLMHHVKANPVQRANFSSVIGIAMVVGGWMAKYSIAALGNRGHTTMNNLLTAVAFACFGHRQERWNMWLGLVLQTPTMERRAGTSAMATNNAIACGMGRGEYQACFANWRAMNNIVAPLVYGKLFAKFANTSVPGMPYFAGAVFILLAEAVFQVQQALDKES